MCTYELIDVLVLGEHVDESGSSVVSFPIDIDDFSEQGERFPPYGLGREVST